MSDQPLDQRTEEEMGELLRELLTSRQAASHRDHDDNAVIAAAISGLPQAREKALALIAGNPEIAEALLLLPPHKATPKVRPRRRLAVVGLIAAGLAGSLAIGVLSSRTWEDLPATLSPKGGPDRLIVAVERSGKPFRAQAGQVIISDDHLGFFYSAERAGHVAVFARDATGGVTIIHPVPGTLSARIDAGRERPLNAGAVADAGSGCEWVIGIFSDQPLPLDELKEDIRQATADPDGCALEVKAAGARSVSVVPFRR